MEKFEHRYEALGNPEKSELDGRINSSKADTVKTKCKDAESATDEIIERLQKEVEVDKEKQPEVVHFIWKITDIEKEVKRLKHGNWQNFYSNLYSTGERGYRFRLYVSVPSGDAAYFGLQNMPANYDNILPWPFKYEIHTKFVNVNEITHIYRSIKGEFSKPLRSVGQSCTLPAVDCNQSTS